MALAEFSIRFSIEFRRVALWRMRERVSVTFKGYGEHLKRRFDQDKKLDKESQPFDMSG